MHYRSVSGGRQHLTRDLKPLAKADLEMVEFQDDSETVVLRVGKKEFFHSTHQDTFLQDISWVRAGLAARSGGTCSGMAAL